MIEEKKAVFWLPRVASTFLLGLVLFLFSCDPAQSKSVPPDFSRENFDEIIHYSLNKYIDPGSVNQSRSYVGAAEAALESLPSPVVIYPRSFYEKRERYQIPRRIVPGRIVEISPSRGYILLIPSYKEWEEKNKKILEEDQDRFQKMSPARRQEEEARIRKRLEEENKALELAWDQVNFTKEDFNSVIQWIEENREEHFKFPPTHKGDNPLADHPFGMNQVFFNATNGFLQSMDPHSGILEAKAWDKIRKESEDSTFEGIGAILRGGGNREVIVETPLANSPALKAGLRAGDIIRKVDGKAIDGLTLNEVVKRIRGPRDTTVVLDVERSQLKTLHAISIVRSVIEQKGVSSEYLPEHNVGILKVSSFLYKGQETSVLVEEEYEDLLRHAKDGKLSGLILDLRSNPGGYLEEAVNVAGLFVDTGRVIVQTRGRNTGMMPRKNQIRPLDTETPMIVLINAGSASASEIVASALMDHNRALILGERSFGKASVQEMPTHGKVILKLTTARYYAPMGYTVQVYGVHPDFPLSDEEDGSFPFKYREENMWKHLPELEKRREDPEREVWIEKIAKIVGDNHRAEEYIQKHKSDARRPDYMLIRALPYLKALKRAGHP